MRVDRFENSIATVCPVSGCRSAVVAKDSLRINCRYWAALSTRNENSAGERSAIESRCRGEEAAAADEKCADEEEVSLRREDLSVCMSASFFVPLSPIVI